MARNLNYAVSGSKCYNNSPANCNTYGMLYYWATAMALPSNCNSSTCSSQVGTKHKGVCPSGWHIPSDAEWTTLTDFVGSSTGIKLKSTSGWNSIGNGTDEFGFSALPGGYGTPDGGFGSVGNRSGWWRPEDSGFYAWGQDMHYDFAGVGIHYEDKANFFSVRCVQD
jgi:uncharacterized protein (TIGR02145 family)